MENGSGKGSTKPDDLGLVLAPLQDRDREQLGMSSDENGVIVAAVEPGSRAGEKGLRRGDVILSVNGKEARSIADFEAAVGASHASGDSARLLVRRGDSQRFVAIGVS
jgi:serine protease Do